MKDYYSNELVEMGQFINDYEIGDEYIRVYTGNGDYFVSNTVENVANLQELMEKQVSKRPVIRTSLKSKVISLIPLVIGVGIPLLLDSFLGIRIVHLTFIPSLFGWFSLSVLSSCYDEKLGTEIPKYKYFIANKEILKEFSEEDKFNYEKTKGLNIDAINQIQIIDSSKDINVINIHSIKNLSLRDLKIIKNNIVKLKKHNQNDSKPFSIEEMHINVLEKKYDELDKVYDFDYLIAERKKRRESEISSGYQKVLR